VIYEIKLWRNHMTERRQLTIPIDKIKENPVALRGVNRQAETFIGLVDSIKKIGVLKPINVREKDDGSGEPHYELIDGLQRFSASCEAGLTEIPAYIVPLQDAEVLEAQVMANVHKIETKPVEYTRQLQRILGANPTMTITDLAVKLAKNPSWVGQRLGLLKLDPRASALVDSDDITLSNAYALAKLPPEEQINFLDRAQTDTPDVFVPAVTARVKEIREAHRAGKEAKPEEFVPTAHMQKMKDVKAEYDKPEVLIALAKEAGVKSVQEAVQLSLAWVLSLDDRSVEAAKARWAEKKKAREEATAKRKAERAAEKAKKAAEEAAKAKVDAEA
jgi:ParB family chromosome partitioning protein